MYIHIIAKHNVCTYMMIDQLKLRLYNDNYVSKERKETGSAVCMSACVCVCRVCVECVVRSD